MALTQADAGLLSPTNAQYTGFKNRIINGAMVIDQRNAGASVTPTGAQYTVDRMRFVGTQSSKLSVQQNAGSVTPPVGFANYLGFTSLSAYSVGAGDIFMLQQSIEGFNTADFAWGTANAKTVTLSAWVYSSLTGTFGGSIQNYANTRSYPFSYTISSANTWTQISITIAGDTSGSWTATNSGSVVVQFGLGVGSTGSGTAGAWSGTSYQSATGATSVVGTNGATFYITGVQLEKGSTATSFDYRPYGTELALCQRYYYRFTNATGTNLRLALYSALNGTRAFGGFTTPVPMRISSPAGSFGSGTYVVLENTSLNASYAVTAFGPYGGASTPTSNLYGLEIDVASGLTAGNLYNLTIFNGGTNSTAFIDLSAEL